MKYYVVTGGTSGIGLSTVKGLSSNPENIVFSISRSSEKIEKAKSETELLPGKVKFLQGDLSDLSNLDAVLAEIRAETDILDGLINCAGVIFPGGIEDLSVEDWNKTLDFNLTSVYAIIKLCVPLLKKRTMSSIVNVSSISSVLLGSSIGYSVCKAALDMLTKGLAKDLSKYRIRVNSVNPGIVNTGFQVSNNLISHEDYPSFLDVISKTYPLGIGDAEDVSNMIFYLLSEKAKWMTGSIVVVDGGRIVNS